MKPTLRVVLYERVLHGLAIPRNFLSEWVNIKDIGGPNLKNQRRET
jgi:hypothetical protein